MRFPLRWFVLILAAGLVVRLVLAAMAQHPGIADPAHYYNLAQSLLEGRGFVIDFIWQYHQPPLDVTHPIDYWMPLPAVWPAFGMALLGKTVLAALIPSVLIGTALAVLTYMIAAAAGLSIPARLMAMATIIFLPEFVLGSVRTDTMISYVLFAGLALVCFYSGLRGRFVLLPLAGAFAGLAMLTRQDGIILAPAMVLGILIFWRFGDRSLPLRWLLTLPLAWLLVIGPWLIRNYFVIGSFFAPGASRTMFMTSFIDQFSYGRTLDLQHYLAWGWPNILGNIAFHILANVKVAYTTLDIALPIIALIGIGGWIATRDKERLLLLVTPVIFIGGLFVFYSFLTPFHSMGGSFKKSYMVLIPFLAVASAWALDTYVQPKRIASIATALIALFMLLNAIELVRADFTVLNRYNNQMLALKDTLNALGDTNGDGRITVMAQDPFMLNYHGFFALMLPSDDRDMILEAAHRYRVDYILLPADRESLDALYNGVETDPRLPLVGTSGDFQIMGVD
jgi:4-amino-4-deoxy-L-arabinose transferase-like glycosyltransferase